MLMPGSQYDAGAYVALAVSGNAQFSIFAARDDTSAPASFCESLLDYICIDTLI